MSKIIGFITPKKPLKTAVLLYVLVICAYAIFFREQTVVADSSKWGEFGDFLGGFINPMIGLITVWLLTVSLKQNEDMLLQSQEELKLTTKQLMHGQEIQKSTEEALRLQVEVSKISTDLASAKVMLDHYEKELKFQSSLNNQNDIVGDLSCKINYLNKFLETEFSYIVARNIDRKISPHNEWLKRLGFVDSIQYTLFLDMTKKEARVEVIVNHPKQVKFKLIFTPDEPFDFKPVNFFEGIESIFETMERGVVAFIDYNKHNPTDSWSLHLCSFLKEDNGQAN